MAKTNDEIRWKKWMLEAQQGNQLSYGNLLSELLPAFRGFARKKISRSADVDDVAQLAVIAIHKSMNTYQADRSFSSWAFTILRYKIIDHYRTSAKFVSVELDESHHPTAEQSSFESEEKTEILEVLENLPQKYKQPILMTKVDGLSVRETAEKLSLSESAVKTRCSRGYQMIKKKMIKSAYE